MIKQVSKIGKNYMYNLFYQILLLITPLITTPYISRVLNADGVGQYSYITAVLSYFLLFGCMGLSTYGQREISYIQGDKKRITQSFFSIQGLSIVLLIVCIICYLICVRFFFYNNHLFAIGVLLIIANLFDINWLFYGLEEFKIPIIRNVIIKILSVALIFIFVKTSNDLLKYLIIMYGSVLVGNLSLWFSLPKKVNALEIKSIHPFCHFKGAFALFVPTIAIQIYVNSDKLMLGVISGNTIANGYYEQAQKIEGLCLLFVTSLGTVVAPRMGKLYSERKFKEIKGLIYKSFSVAWMVSIPVAIGLCCIAKGFVPWFFGEGYEQVRYLLYINSWIIVAISLSNVTGTQYLIPTQRQSLFTLSVVLGMIVNIIMNFWLIPSMLAIGAAIATLTSEILVSSIQIFFIRKDISIKKVACSSIKYWISGIVMGLCLTLVNSFFPISIFSTLVVIVMGGIIYCSLLWMMKDELFLGVVLKVKGVIIRK